MNTPITFETLCARILALPRLGTRHLIAVAGPPGSGKSTVAEKLTGALTAQGRAAALVPMDGFHLDNDLLEQDGLLDRKGAPETFDSAGFVALIGRLVEPQEVCFARFDRARDISIAQAGRISEKTDIVLVEGNYLLLDRPVWRDLAAFWRLSVWLEVPCDTLRSRLVSRWLGHGLDSAAAAARCDENDMRNVLLVSENRLESSFILSSE